MKPKISIIILNWNGWEDTLECLKSIYKINYPYYDIVVVDNGSDDDSIAHFHEYADETHENSSDSDLTLFEYSDLEENFHENYFKLNSDQRLILFKNSNNQGFSAGNNIGINFSLKNLGSDYILLLNNDTVVHENFLEEMVDFAEKDSQVGIVGPGVYYYDKPEKLAYVGHNMDLCTAKVLDPPYQDGKPLKVDYIVGCSLLIKRAVIEKIGLLDPDYFLYYEDADWCLRAKKKGYTNYYVPKAKIWHKISDENRSVASYYYGNRNSFLIVKKNKRSKTFCYIKMFLNKSILSTYLIVTGKHEQGFAVLKAVYDGILGHYGQKKL